MAEASTANEVSVDLSASEAIAQGRSADGASRSSTAVLDVEDLTVSIPTEDGVVRAVRGVSLSIEPGKVLGVVGESGCGKSMTALAVMGLLPAHAQVTGALRLGGEDLIGMSERRRRRLRGSRMAMVFQDPMTALNPMYTIGWQVAEAVKLHEPVGRRAAAARAVELLGLVGLPDPAIVARQHPHELSGGMRQRVMVAMAVANRPALIIADEPTTALDVTVQAQLLELIGVLREETDAALLLITHDLGVVAGVADEVLVMYAGLVAERGPCATVFASPQMPYTRGLLASIPRLDVRAARLQPIAGNPPSMLRLTGGGCAFAPRCSVASERCAQQPELEPVGPDHVVACHHPQHGRVAVHTAPAGDRVLDADATEVLRVRDLSKQFTLRTGLRGRRIVDAVSGIDLDLHQGETLAVVGESGCGKTTTARMLVRLQEPSAGTVHVDGIDLAGLDEDQLRPLRTRIQMVFQDPYASLNPRLSVRDIVAEPLVVHGVADRDRRVRELLEMVGIEPASATRYPHEFSGGQRQRIGIARALALRPEIVVLDEPVSALDVSIQASVLNLLADLRDELGLAYVFIAHDLSVVRHIADRLAVMYLGRIVETGAADVIYAAPAHPYTKALLSAVPIPDPTVERVRQRILLEGDVPSPVDPPSGCRFRTRCWKADEICATTVPELTAVSTAHAVACHHPELPTAAATPTTRS